MARKLPGWSIDWANAAGWTTDDWPAVAAKGKSHRLKAAGWNMLSVEIRYLAKNFTELSELARKEVTDFLNTLDDHDDVHRVYAAIN